MAYVRREARRERQILFAPPGVRLCDERAQLFVERRLARRYAKRRACPVGVRLVRDVRLRQRAEVVAASAGEVQPAGEPGDHRCECVMVLETVSPDALGRLFDLPGRCLLGASASQR